MTQSQIQYFLLVAKEKGISKAAEILFVSPPAVSRQLSVLEDELGAPLFDRRNRGIEITEAGLAFENLFSNFQMRFKETLRAIHNRDKQLSGNYYLGCLEGWDLSSFYPDIHVILKQKYPEIQLHLDGYNLDQMLYALRRGEVDGVIAITSLFDCYNDILTQHLTQINGLLLFSVRHQLAQKENLKLSDFRSSTFYVTAPQGMKIATIDLISICKSSGFIPKLEYLPTLSAAYMKLQSEEGVNTYD